MKPQRLVLLALAFAATGAVGCFTDPTKDLRSGGTTLSVSDQAIYLRTGDSVAVVAELKDNQGNVLPAAGASWATGDASIADVRMDTVVIPGNYFTRGFIRGVIATGGWTSVIVAIGNVADTLRVTVLPANVTASLVSRSGSAKADSVLYPAQLGPPPVAAKYVAFSAPDTLVLSGTSVLNFDTAKVSLYANSPAGKAPGFVIAKTPTQVKAVFTVPAIGKVVVKNLLEVTGNPNVGTIAIDSLVTDSLAIAKVRFVGSAAQAGDTTTVNAGGPYDLSAATVKVGAGAGVVFARTAPSLSFLTLAADTGDLTLLGAKLGTVKLDSVKINGSFTTTIATYPGAITQAGDTMTINSSANTSFITSGTSATTVAYGSKAGIVFGSSASALQVLSPVAYTGVVTVKNVQLGIATISALKTSGSYTMNAATFPGTVTALGPLLDTIKVYATASAKFDTASSKLSQVIIQGSYTGTASNYAGYVILRTPDSMYVISRVGNNNPITVTNVVVGGAALIPQLSTPGNITVSNTVTGELNEPGNNASATATPVSITGPGTYYIYGAMNDGGTTPSDTRDYYTFTLGAAATDISITLSFPGNGSGDSNNPDFDVVICNALSSTAACTYTQDLMGGAASATNEPEAGSTGAVPAGQYWIRTYAYPTTNGNVAYQIKVVVQ